jgi:hypothetical protein
MWQSKEPALFTQPSNNQNEKNIVYKVRLHFVDRYELVVFAKIYWVFSSKCTRRYFTEIFKEHSLKNLCNMNSASIPFGQVFLSKTQVFYKSRLSLGIVNLKPVVKYACVFLRDLMTQEDMSW